MNFGTLFDSLLAILGFSMLVVIHEFGHFAAARWAGVRVLTFAVGFGRAMATYRKGLGFRFGSSEADYLRMARAGQAGTVSPTEYRLNILPFGGYVKMLGQDDLAPNAISDAPDSYQMCKPWKRMVIISAGVVMNVLAALVLFMIVFGLGLKTEAPVIGDIALGSPAAQASSVDPKNPNGLRAGDRVVRIDGDRTRAFNEIVISAAMASRGDALRFEVERQGSQHTLQFDVTPRTDSSNGLPTIGIGPAAENTIVAAEDETEAKVLRDLLDSIGLTGVEPGMRLVKAGSIENPANGDAVEEACHASGGNPVQLVFEDAQGKRAEATVVPRAELASGEIRLGKEDRRAMGHIAGMVPVLRVGELPADTRGYKAGLRSGDIFEKVGDTAFPSMFQGVSEIRSRAGGTVDLVVLRKTATGDFTRLTFPGIAVSPEGQVGIVIETTAQESAMVAMSPAEFYDDAGRPLTLPKNNLIGKQPCNLISVNGKPVQTLIEARRELQDATRPLITGEVDSVKVEVVAVPLATEGEPPRDHRDSRVWTSGRGVAPPPRLGEPLWNRALREVADVAESVHAVRGDLDGLRRDAQGDAAGVRDVSAALRGHGAGEGPQGTCGHRPRRHADRPQGLDLADVLLRVDLGKPRGGELSAAADRGRRATPAAHLRVDPGQASAAGVPECHRDRGARGDRHAVPVHHLPRHPQPPRYLA